MSVTGNEVQVENFVKENLFLIDVNGEKKDCTVDKEKKTTRKSIKDGSDLELYECTLLDGIKDTSGFWIHKDCLKGDKIRENTFDVPDIRKSLNGKTIRIVSQENGGDYVRVTVGDGVSRKEFLRQKEEIFKSKNDEGATPEHQPQPAPAPEAPPPAQQARATAQPPPPPPPPAQPAQQETKYDFTGIFNEISLTNEQKQGGIDELIAILKGNNMNENCFIKTTQNNFILLNGLKKDQYKSVSKILFDSFIKRPANTSDLGSLEKDESVKEIELNKYKLKE